MPVFPLPLKGFEELFVVDDNPPHYPAVCSFRLAFDGPLDAELAQQALDATVARQPMLRSRLDGTSNKTLRWIESASFRPLVRVIASDQPPADRLQPFDLSNEPPFELTLHQQDAQTFAVLRFHHAAFDGLGALQVLNDWMRAYDQPGNHSNAKSAHQLNNELLKNRCTAALRFRERLRLAPLAWLSLLGFWNFFFNRPIPLIEVKPTERSLADGQPITVGRLSVDATKYLKTRAQEASVTVNDLLVAELFAAVLDWQVNHRSASDPTSLGSHLRITVPISERTARHRRMPGCNHCTMISVDRRPSQVNSDAASPDFSRLLQFIHRDIDTVRQWRLSLSFWRALSVFRRLGGLKRWFANDSCRSTCVLTNLGKISLWLRLKKRRDGANDGMLRLGEVNLTSIDIAAPIRSGTAAAFNVFFYRQRLNVTLNYDPTRLMKADAEALLGNFVDRLSTA